MAFVNPRRRRHRRGCGFTPSAGTLSSTLYGLRGHSVTTQQILKVLKAKTREEHFRLRILLTHWDHISSRQDQEKGQKAWARVVISRELLQAVGDLKSMGLSDRVRFYRGAPTCSSIFCEGQEIMLANPYPYQSEAIRSWAAIFRGGRIYEEFKKAHIDDPWDSTDLAVDCNEDAEQAVTKKVNSDLDLIRATPAHLPQP